MKTRYKEIIKELCSLFTEEYKEKIKYITKIPFIQEGLKGYTPVFDIITKEGCNVAPSLREYYLNVYSLLSDMYSKLIYCDNKELAFAKIFIDDVISFLEMYYRILKNSYITTPSERSVMSSVRGIFNYMSKVYFKLGNDIYKEVFKDILGFISNIDDLFEFSIVMYSPFLCSIDKSYYNDCINVYRDEIYYRDYNIFILISRLCQKYLKRNILRNKVLNSIKQFRDISKKLENSSSSEIKTEDFVIYLFIDIYNNIFHNINVENLFKLLKYIDCVNIFYFSNKETLLYLSPKILDTFINTLINVDKNNFNILEKISNIDISISDFVCNIILHDIVMNEIRKGNENDILIKTNDCFDFFGKYIDIFSKYEYLPSFIKAFIYCVDHRYIVYSIKNYLDSKCRHSYSCSLCDIYLNNPGILYNIISSEKFYKMYYKTSFSFGSKRSRKYEREYWVMFRNFVEYMEIVEQKNRVVKFEDFVLSDNVWDDSNYIVEHFPLITCFVILPMLIVKNGRNDIKYINKLFDNIIRIIFKGKIRSNSKNIGLYAFEIINGNEKFCNNFYLTNNCYSTNSEKIINCLIFVCLLYYFGINLIDDCTLQNKIKAIFNKIDKKMSRNIFNIIYILYNNLANKSLEEIIDLSVKMYKLV